MLRWNSLNPRLCCHSKEAPTESPRGVKRSLTGVQRNPLVITVNLKANQRLTRRFKDIQQTSLPPGDSSLSLMFPTQLHQRNGNWRCTHPSRQGWPQYLTVWAGSWLCAHSKTWHSFQFLKCLRKDQKQKVLFSVPKWLNTERSYEAGYSPWGCKESDTTETLHFTALPVFLPRESYGQRSLAGYIQSMGVTKELDTT